MMETLQRFNVKSMNTEKLQLRQRASKAKQLTRQHSRKRSPFKKKSKEGVVRTLWSDELLTLSVFESVMATLTVLGAIACLSSLVYLLGKAVELIWSR